jgi:rRNA maturation RNase YbeY
MVIQVHSENKQINDYEKRLIRLTKWMCSELRLTVNSIDIIFVDDDCLKQMHEKFLNDNSYTDVMTFNLADDALIEGEIYISLDRVWEQAQDYQVSVLNEISRLLIHACLHLAGFDDKHPQQKGIMKTKEEVFLKRVKDLFLI